MHTRWIERNKGRIKAGHREIPIHHFKNIMNQWLMEEWRFRLLHKEPIFLESLIDILIKRFLEESFSWSDWVRAVNDNNIVVVFLFPHVSQAITDGNSQLRIILPHSLSYSWQKFLGQFHNLSIDFHHGHRFYFWMTNAFPGYTAITTADNENPFRVWMEEERNMSHHFMVDEFLFF